VSLFRLALRSATHYWRTNLAVLLGVSAAVAVLGGALLVGDSVRGSLREIALGRLGKADQALSSAQFFRAALADELRTLGLTSAPLIVATSFVTHEPSGKRAGGVVVYGVDERFWAFHGVQPADGPAISPALAAELGARTGDVLLVRLQRPSEIPIESLFGRKEEIGRTLRATLADVQWERLVLDEAQNIKSIETKQTRAIRGLKARHRVALTGTPVENRLSELHSIMDFLNPGLLGSATGFRERYANPIERYRDVVATRRLRDATGPFILRRLKTDTDIISDLPEKIEMRIDCHLTREQATLYQAVVDEMLEKAEAAVGFERAGIILAALIKLKQVCNHPAHLLKDRSRLDGRSGKLARLEEIVDEAVAQGDRALCFTQFAEFGHELRAHFQERLGREVLFLHGGTTKAARDEMVARFQDASPSAPPLFVLSLKAGGTGLNLTAANHVIHFDRWWNPAVENQATDRAFRIGQRKNVQVRKLTCVGTLEERIDQLIAEKKDLADRIIGSGEAGLAELDSAQLRELVALSADAVAA